MELDALNFYQAHFVTTLLDSTIVDTKVES